MTLFRNMKYLFVSSIFFLAFLLSQSSCAQTISKEELIFLTSSWKGERFADGRPKVADALLERAAHVNIDDAWTVLKNNGYVNQFDGNWKMVKQDVPVIGRAVTAMFMPSRPDVHITPIQFGGCTFISAF